MTSREFERLTPEEQREYWEHCKQEAKQKAASRANG